MSSTVRTTPVVVNVERTEIIVSEDEMVDVCVSAVDVGSAVISVSVTDDPGTTTQGMVRILTFLWQMDTIICLYRLIYVAPNEIYCGILISRPKLLNL